MSRHEVVYEITHVFGLEEMQECLIRVHDERVLMNHANPANVATNNNVAAERTFDSTPSLYLKVITEALLDDGYALVAIRDIEPGDEITPDYADEEGIGESAFFEELYEHYGVHRGPPLKRMIRTSQVPAREQSNATE
ncbi:MAG: hypothetical protein CMM46_15325 [Rhodospirillaceae bacterium]|nr:hypothetical protein [Rhodospirillaceae bacterium]|tara:strand:- start:2267 stop:2680 length:414 start_codon:yes stop_codon:yes gene_type:complete